MNGVSKPRISIHKFSSCDGCQLSLLNLGEALLDVVEQLDIQHFAEAGLLNELAPVDIAIVEGSISTPADVERIRSIRNVSRFVVTIGACATAGGLQALRNAAAGAGDWPAQIYASPEYLSGLDKVTAIREQVHVDWEIWGCPVNKSQVLEAIIALGRGHLPLGNDGKLCLECKRRHHVCVAVARGEPCMGPLTRQGCGALCPAVGRGCYGCYGPAENSNPEALLDDARRWREGDSQLRDNYQGIYSNIAPFKPCRDLKDDQP